METREHELIRQKLETVTGLPDGYAPNLDSKWELLEASLNKSERAKKPLFWISAIGSAAALFVVSTLLMITMRQEMPVPEKNKVTEKALKAEPGVIQQAVVQQKNQPEEITGRNKRNHVPVQLKNNEPVVGPVPENIPDEVPAETLMVLTEKTPRFVEMDFNEPVINNQAPSETVMESQRFRFRIGVGGQSSASVPASGEKTLFSKKIN